jgi:hypothetical protein
MYYPVCLLPSKQGTLLPMHPRFNDCAFLLGWLMHLNMGWCPSKLWMWNIDALPRVAVRELFAGTLEIVGGNNGVSLFRSKI